MSGEKNRLPKMRRDELASLIQRYGNALAALSTEQVPARLSAAQQLATQMWDHIRETRAFVPSSEHEVFRRYSEPLRSPGALVSPGQAVEIELAGTRFVEWLDHFVECCNGHNRQNLPAVEGGETASSELDPRRSAVSSPKPVNEDSPARSQSVGYYCAKDLAGMHRIPEGNRLAFEKAIERWRKKNALASDFIEHDSPVKNKPKFVYRETALKHIIDQYQATG